MIAWLLRRAASCFCLLCAASAAAGVVRTKADLRLWQTVDDRAAPLEWPWADDADFAALVFSNRLTGAVSSAAVSRGEGEKVAEFVLSALEKRRALKVPVITPQYVFGQTFPF